MRNKESTLPGLIIIVIFKQGVHSAYANFQ